MPVLVASPTLGDLLKLELSANYNRETVTLKAGTSYALGSMLGKITASGNIASRPPLPWWETKGPRWPSPSSSRRSMPPQLRPPA